MFFLCFPFYGIQFLSFFTNLLLIHKDNSGIIWSSSQTQRCLLAAPMVPWSLVMSLSFTCIVVSLYVSKSVQAAITKCHRLGALNIYFSPLGSPRNIYFSRLGSSRSRCWQVQCLVRTLLLVCSHDPAVSLHDWKRKEASSFISLLIKALTPSWELQPHNLIISQRPHL